MSGAGGRELVSLAGAGVSYDGSPVLHDVDLVPDQLVGSFEARNQRWWTSGTAAHVVLLRLLLRGGVTAAKPTSFHVDELDRAAAWGHHLAAAVEHGHERRAA